MSPTKQVDEEEAIRVNGYPNGKQNANAMTPSVPPVAPVVSPSYPSGVRPDLTHYPTPPLMGFNPRMIGSQPQVGGVPGVYMAPVTPAAAPGGPHPLPSVPVPPFPHGFPNPFAIQALQVLPEQPLPQRPGTMTVTGPLGYHPGLGYFQPGAGPVIT
jgi:hypothetical protein